MLPLCNNKLTINMMNMKRILKKALPLLLLASVLSLGGVATSCKSSEKTMYERHQSSKSRKVKSNIKVKGTNTTHGHTTRSY